MALPRAHPSITAYLAVHDGQAAIEFYQSVFGAEPIDGERYDMDDGRLGHISLAIGDSLLYLSDEFPEVGAVGPHAAGASTVALIFWVDDVDATYDAAIEEGAIANRPPANERSFRNAWFVDPFGHRIGLQGPEAEPLAPST